MAYDAPQSRNEAILQNILGANNVLGEPQSRIEAILQSILNETSYTAEAMSRMEELLLAIKNSGVWNHTPISRNEEILYAKLTGGEYNKEPQSRIEELLIDWLNHEPSFVIDTAPYLFRQSGGDNNAYVGTEETDKLVGASSVVNQLVQNGNFADTSNWTTYRSSASVANNELTATVTSGNGGTIFQDIPVVVGHKYFVTAYAKVGTAERVRITYNNAIAGWTEVTSAAYTSTNKVGQATTSSLRVALSVYGDGLTGMCKDFNVFDLTAMFGTAIADYIYSLEQATAGSGIAYLRKYGFFTKDYYPYTANTLQSVNTSKHVMRDGSDVIIGEYTLPNIDLRGLYKLDANNNLYADGDTLEGDGTLTRKYRIVDLGTMNWNKRPNNSIFYSTSLQDFYAIKGDYSIVYNYLCPIYISVSRSNLPNVDKSIALNWSDLRYVSIKDSAYSDKDAFKTAMSGVYLIYELTTPTTETATGFTNPQIVDKYGTEEYTDERDFPLPAGHETKYPS